MSSTDNEATQEQQSGVDRAFQLKLPRQPKKKLSWGKKFLILLLVLIALRYAYGNWDGKFNRWYRWTEEVQLSSGEVIWVNRSTRYYTWSSINSGGRANRVSSIQFKSPLNLPEWHFDIARDRKSTRLNSSH